jgi:oxygen-independent coproporphyrinogen-3 oxidase
MRAVKEQKHIIKQCSVPPSEQIFEFMLNNLRLIDGFDTQKVHINTQIDWSVLEPMLVQLMDEGLIDYHANRVKASELGYRFLDQLTERFLPH